MADENVGKPEEAKASSPEANDIFSKMSEIAPLRDVESEDEDLDKGDDEHGTLEERIEGSRKLTDIQVADKRLNPDLGKKHLNVIEMSRTFPDIYNPMFRILVKDLIKNSGTEMSVAEAIAYVNTALSISIDGEGRIDVITIMKHGATLEEEKNKSVGIP